MASYSSLTCLRAILPDALRGNHSSSTKTTSFGFLKLASVLLTIVPMSSEVSVGSRLATNATGTSPHVSSRRPITQTSATRSSSSKARSISAG